MKIALIGYGKMGREIEKIAVERGHTITHKIDIETISRISKSDLAKADVAIEFTRPEAAYTNILKCFESDIPVVSGTTGWLDKLPDIKNRCETESKTLFYAANFSIGVNLFFKVNTFLAKLMNKQTDYELELTETHHTQKLDAPSGTAIRLAEDIIQEIDRKSEWISEKKSDDNQLTIKSFRESDVPGIHTVKYESGMDVIEIKHELKNRQSLALGAVLAAEFAQKNRGFLTMEQLLNF